MTTETGNTALPVDEGADNRLLPGIMVTVLIGISAMFLSQHYGAPVMLMALLLGMAFNFLAELPKTQRGLQFSATTVLRAGVALLGVRISFEELATLGWVPLLAVLFLVVLTIFIGVIAGRMARLEGHLGLLTGCAVAICGASATAAVAAVLPESRSRQQSVVFTIIGVTSLSTLAMILYPLLVQWLQLTDVQAGFFLGATIHDVAQVVGAGYAVSNEAGNIAVVTKLFRVALLVPVVVTIALLTHNKGTRGSKALPLPGFLIAFLCLMIINTLGYIPEQLADQLSALSRWFLIFSIAAIGMRTNLGSLRQVGAFPMGLLVAETTILALMGLGTAIWFL